jgi:predicted transcriptional regulator
MSSRDITIYKKFLEAKAKKENIGDFAKRLKISRSGLYLIVSRIEKGTPSSIKREVEAARLSALWKYRFAGRILSLPDDRKKGTVARLKRILKEMKKEGFSHSDIAARVKKDRATIIYHLK